MTRPRWRIFSPMSCAKTPIEAGEAPPAAEVPTAAVSWRHRAEFCGAALFFAAMRALPLSAASAVGGALGRLIGPRLGVSARARNNLRAALPELSPPQVEAIVSGMWDNLGRVAAEYPHLRRIKVFD